MRADELRSALDVAAEHVTLAASADAARAAITRKVRRARRQRAAAVVGLCAIAALVVALIVGSGSNPLRVEVEPARGAKEVDRASELLGPEAWVVLAQPADATEANRLRGVLDASSDVEQYLYLPYGWSSLTGMAGCADADQPAFAVDLHWPEDNDPTRRFEAAIAPATVDRGLLGVGGRARSREWDLEIFFDVDAPDDVVAAAFAEVQASSSVDHARLLTKDDARSEFERIFADDPDLVERVDTESLPQSVRIRMRSGQSVDALRERFAGAPGVDEVVEFKPFGGLFADRDVTIPPHGLDGLAVDVEIFLDLEATDDEARAVESALAKDAAVASVDEVTKPEAFEEFREVFAGQPSLVENVDPDGFPASFRVTLVDSADAAAFEARYRQLPGVDEVVSPDVSVGCFGFPTR